jgi:hypothetical protein
MRWPGNVGFDQLLQRVRAEFMEMPGLRLTVAQAQRLWSIDQTLCLAILVALVDVGFLMVTRDGAYVRLHTV